jgi:ABC-type hemin transport system substrate-binding protein
MDSRGFAHIPRVLAALLLLILAACGNDSTPGRDASNSPAITATLRDLGLADRLVGRSRFCEGVDDVTVVGDLLDVDYETLVRLDPTHILVQPPSSGTDAGLLALAGERKWKVSAWSLAGLADVRTMLAELPSAIAPDPGPLHQHTTERANAMLAEIDAALAPDPRDNPIAACGRTLLVEKVNPILAFGRGSYLDQMFTAMGGENAVQIEGYPELSLEDVIRLDPDTIIVVRSRADGLTASSALGPIAAADLRAIREGRIGLLAHPDALLPGSGLGRAAEALKQVAESISAARRQEP